MQYLPVKSQWGKRMNAGETKHHVFGDVGRSAIYDASDLEEEVRV